MRWWWKSGTEVYGVFGAHRVRGRKMLPIAMVLGRGRSGQQLEGEQATLVPHQQFLVELCSCPSPPCYSCSTYVSTCQPSSTACRTDLYGDHAGVTVKFGDDDSDQTKVSVTRWVPVLACVTSMLHQCPVAQCVWYFKVHIYHVSLQVVPRQ